MLTKSAIEVVWPPLEAGRGKEWILSCSLQKESSTDEAISDFWPPELQENKFPLLAPSLWSCVTATTEK